MCCAGEGKIGRKSAWSAARVEVPELSAALVDPVYRVLDEGGLRKRFQAFVDDLEASAREEERLEKEAVKRQVNAAQEAFRREVLEPLVAAGRLVDAGTKWRVFVGEHEAQWREAQPPAYLALLGHALKAAEGAGKSATAGATAGSESSEPVAAAGPFDAEVVANSALFRDCFEGVTSRLREQLRDDRRLVREVLDALGVKIQHDTELEAVANRLREYISSTGSTAVSSDSKAVGAMREMLEQRPYNVSAVFHDLQAPFIEAKKAADEKKARREAKYIALLQEYYYRSDHVEVTWDEAKRELDSHSAYSDLERSERKRLFEEYMTSLRGGRQRSEVKLVLELMSMCGVCCRQVGRATGRDEGAAGVLQRKCDAEHDDAAQWGRRGGRGGRPCCYCCYCKCC